MEDTKSSDAHIRNKQGRKIKTEMANPDLNGKWQIKTVYACFACK